MGCVQLLLWSDLVSMYVVMSCSSGGSVVGGVLCGSAPRLYDLIDRVQFRE
jgi:hypothetical protein